MPVKMSIFRRLILMLVLLMIPILILYTYSNRVSVDVVRNEVKESNLQHLSFLLKQAEMTVEQLTLAANTIGSFQVVDDLIHINEKETNYEKVVIKQDIIEKLRLSGASSNWTNQFTVYSPSAGTGVTTLNEADYAEMFAPEKITKEWKYRETSENGALVEQFVKHTVYPGSRLIVEVSFTVDNIRNMLDQIKMKGKNDPFFYREGDHSILNRTADSVLSLEVASYLDQRDPDKSGTEYVQLQGRQYMVNYVKSEMLNWVLVDYVPLEYRLSPIKNSSLLFYASIAMLLAMSVVFALMLYRNVQVPVSQLLQGVRKLERGQFSVRLSNRRQNEFSYLFHRFNQMASQIEQLIENVYNERIRSREATLKQLQSQINPHFLYNSLAFIKSMTELDEKEAVIRMTLNLSQYYRYTTRVENQETTIREETDLVRHYLTIQTLQMQRFEFEFRIPEEMMELRIPRLLLQPIVENAIVHGIEPRMDWGMLLVWGERTEADNRLVVEDNGAGLSPEELDLLRQKLEQQLEEEMGCGLWNVHQRLKYRFGTDAGVTLEPRLEGGLRVTLHWPRIDETGGNP
ncbi:sensor histidine kinase [Cohnella sp. GCM10027633]|uniref:sensor histidine kinase n=1 Tax=unclassified Cohnella TaxID=2636738 RepID=UPI00362EF48F